MTDNTRPDTAPPQTLTATKRSAVRALRQAQGRIERGEWATSIALIIEAQSLTAQCAEHEVAIND
jgi:hypothetical protein